MQADIDVRLYFTHAKHSVGQYMRFVGVQDSWPFLAKWADIAEDLFKDDKDKLREDLTLQICEPFKAIAETLIEKSKDPPETKKVFLDEVKNAAALAVRDPINAKSQLITLCNNQINKRRVAGEPLALLEDYKHDRDSC